VLLLHRALGQGPKASLAGGSLCVALLTAGFLANQRSGINALELEMPTAP
jgi:hypothetical protein